MQSSPLPCYLVPLRPKYPPQHPVLNYRNLIPANADSLSRRQRKAVRCHVNETLITEYKSA
jgi:hypothetical protein